MLENRQILAIRQTSVSITKITVLLASLLCLKLVFVILFDYIIYTEHTVSYSMFTTQTVIAAILRSVKWLQ